MLAIEPNPELRSQALSAASSAPVAIHVVNGSAVAIDCGEDSVDTVVSSLVLCSVPDPARVLAELLRILKPGGQFLFYEHVRSTHPLGAVVEDFLTPAWSALAGGCHPNRDTLAAIAEAGFTVEAVERFGHSTLPGTPQVAHVLGVAVRPA